MRSHEHSPSTMISGKPDSTWPHDRTPSLRPPVPSSGRVWRRDRERRVRAAADVLVRSDLFAWEAKPEVRGLVRDWKDLERITTRHGLLLVHHSMGNDVVSDVAKLPVRKAVVYHNITPAKYFEGLNEHARKYAELGREQLAELARSAEFGEASGLWARPASGTAGATTRRPRATGRC